MIWQVLYRICILYTFSSLSAETNCWFTRIWVSDLNPWEPLCFKTKWCQAKVFNGPTWTEALWRAETADAKPGHPCKCRDPRQDLLSSVRDSEISLRFLSQWCHRARLLGGNCGKACLVWRITFGSRLRNSAQCFDFLVQHYSISCIVYIYPNIFIHCMSYFYNHIYISS